jgi:hypothetical protein
MARSILLAAIALLLAVPAGAYGAQMEVHIASDDTEIAPSYKFLRVININYQDGGVLAELLSGKSSEISFSADSKTSDMRQLLEKINLNLRKVSSTVLVTDVTVHYKATLVSGKESASMEYNIDLVPVMKNYEIGRDSASTFLDAQWRGLKISGPVIIDTVQFGSFDINSPESALQVIAPFVLEEIKKTDAIQILNIELLDASKILELPLYKWHFLFDPTAILEETKGTGYQGTVVVSYYTMGECKIGIGSCEDRVWQNDFVTDKKYQLSAIESQDYATISIEGYASYRELEGVEIFGVSPNSPEVYRTNTGGFPIGVIYGMAGMAGIGALVILTFSHRKLKKEEGMGQTGIEPSQLRAQETSSSAGSYQTNRVEGHLIERRSPI